MRICLIGPTYPFRGGIAHHTTLLCRALRRNHDVKFISFKRQYPRILFPGRSDKDTSREPLKIDDVDYLLDSLNPLTWIEVSRNIAAYHPDKVVIPWWVAFWTPQFWSIVALVKRNVQSEIVFICHNVIEHESHLVKKMAARAVLSKADRIITHSKEDTLKLKDLLGNGVNAITAFHPTYPDLRERRYTKDRGQPGKRGSGP